MFSAPSPVMIRSLSGLTVVLMRPATRFTPDERAAAVASQEDRLEPYDRLFASFGDGNDDVEGHAWTYNWVQYPAGQAAQSNVGGFRMRPVDGDIAGDGFKGLWFNS